jgi:hypothetical protein
MLAFLDVLSDFLEPFAEILFKKLWKKCNPDNPDEKKIRTRKIITKTLGIIIATASLTAIIYAIYFLIHWYS